jgi:hypothetical protein
MVKTIYAYGARKWAVVQKNGLLRNHRVNIYEFLWVGEMTKLPLALKLWYKPSGAYRSSSTPLHRTTTSLPQSASSRRKPCDPATCLVASKLLSMPGSRLRPPSLRSRFCGCKPSMQTPVVSR